MPTTQSRTLEVVIAHSAGTCFGVEDAIETRSDLPPIPRSGNARLSDAETSTA